MKSTADILETNKKQREFYNDIRQNFATRLWARVRNGLLNRVRKNAGIQDQVYALHQKWLGDLSDKKVLDLGCFAGNYLSIYLAKNAKTYIGIDLSDVAIGKLAARIQDFPGARVQAVDFLSDEFDETGFDLIYAYGVLHHFPNAEVLSTRLNEKLKDGGQIISYDPLETSLPVKILRTLYRPFQSDAEWEWPFTRKTVAHYQRNFEIIERRGILGRAKWAVVLNLLPLGESYRNRVAGRWNARDWKESATSDAALFRCMHLTMLMRKKA